MRELSVAYKALVTELTKRCMVEFLNRVGYVDSKYLHDLTITAIKANSNFIAQSIMDALSMPTLEQGKRVMEDAVNMIVMDMLILYHQGFRGIS